MNKDAIWRANVVVKSEMSMILLNIVFYRGRRLGMNRIFKNTIFYLLIFLVLIGIVSWFNNTNETTENISYNKFVNHLENGDIDKFSIQPERGVYEIIGHLKGTEKDKQFTTYVMNSPAMLDRIDKAAANVEVLPAKETSGWVSFFTTIIPFIIIFILFFFLLNQAQGGEAV